MDRNEKKLMRYFQEKAEYPESKKKKIAATLRKSMKKKGKRERFKKRWDEDTDNAPSFEKKLKGPSLDDLAASDGGEAADERKGTEDRDAFRKGIVIALTRRFCTVLEGAVERNCYLPAKLAAVQQSEVAIGDRVLFFAKPDGSLMIHEVDPRDTFLARPDPHNARKQRVIAANIDTVVNVVSVKSPPLRPRLIDRYLIAITRGGARPVVCVNKTDLLEGSSLDEELVALDVYRELGLEIVRCSASKREGLDELHEAIRGGTSVFVGHSGVGKSSLLKRLVAHLEVDDVDADAIKTADVASGSGMGRHTTRSSTLFDLGSGTRIIDTPGIREFGLWNLDEEALRDYFPEFEDWAPSCRFNDCTHIHEPRCAVKDAVESGEVNSARFETYLRIVEELKEGG